MAPPAAAASPERDRSRFKNDCPSDRQDAAAPDSPASGRRGRPRRLLPCGAQRRGGGAERSEAEGTCGRGRRDSRTRTTPRPFARSAQLLPCGAKRHRGGAERSEAEGTYGRGRRTLRAARRRGRASTEGIHRALEPLHAKRRLAGRSEPRRARRTRRHQRTPHAVRRRYVERIRPLQTTAISPRPLRALRGELFGPEHTAAGSASGGVVTMRSLGARLEEARLGKKKEEDGRWMGTQGVLATRKPKLKLPTLPGSLTPRNDARQ